MVERIAILGGGMASLTAAFALTSVPGWQAKYAITIHQHGWRLGGKGASGRNLAVRGRIEEHGLHFFFGWYENVFKVLRGAYQELSGDPNRWKNAFLKFDGAVTMQEHIGDRYVPWPIQCPHDDDAPGDGKPVDIDPWALAQKAIDWALAQLTPTRHGFAEAATLRETVAALPADHRLVTRAQLEKTRDIVDQAQARLHAQPALSETDDLRRMRILTSMVLAMGRGVITGMLLEGTTDWFVLDSFDLREWLAANGASSEVLQSAPVDALYDAAFSGFSTMGAGTILQALLRAAFTWRGSAVWRLNGGMGDVVFAPLYEVLARRGVRFEFFHRVEALELSADRRSVERVRVDQQVSVKGGGCYRPLTTIAGPDGPADVWPTGPLVAQLDVDPAKLVGHDLEDWWDSWRGTPVTLQRGQDFDTVVLGISVGALSNLCAELVRDDGNPAFGEMVRGLVTTQTRAAQLWMGVSYADLKWPGPCTIPFVEPYDTACQMDHLIPWEPGSSAAGVKTIAYLCSPLDDDEPPPPRWDTQYPARQHARAFQQAQDWLGTSATVLWPGAAKGGAFDWSLLVGPPDQQGPARMQFQYVNTPNNPSDRYVLIARGSNRFRLRADQSGYANVVLAGDWTKTALSGGFLESAAMGGVQAARAIDPSVPKAVGDWLPDLPPSASDDPPPPTFVLRDGDLLAKPPLDLDIVMYVFILAADAAALGRVLDQQLNWASQRYQPLLPYVALYLSSLNIDAPPFARVPAMDFGIWVPVVETGSAGTRLVTYTPYLWADNGWALIGGREVFGFPKQLGSEMIVPSKPGDPGRFSLKTMVLPTAQSTAVVEELFSVQRTDSQDLGERRRDFSSAAQLRAALASRLDGRLDASSASRRVAVRGGLGSLTGMSMVFLKQFPTQGGDPSACYRAVVETTLDPLPTDFQAGILAGKYDMTLRRFASHQIASTLGLAVTIPGAGQDLLSPVEQFWMKTRMRLQPGAVRAATEAPETPDLEQPGGCLDIFGLAKGLLGRLQPFPRNSRVRLRSS